MATVDFRTRFEGDQHDLEPDDFVENQLLPLISANGGEAGRGATRLNLAPLTFDIGDDLITFEIDNERLTVRPGGANDDGSLSLLTETRSRSSCRTCASTFGLEMSGRAEIRSGTLDAFVEWEPVLRCLLDGRPMYEPGAVRFENRQGRPARPASIIFSLRRAR